MLLPHLLREYEQAEALASQALEQCEQYSFSLYAAFSRIFLGYARSHLGCATEGIALIRRGLAELVKLGASNASGTHIAELAAALGRQGAIVEALETVERALQLNPEELFFRPEMLRIRGELRLQHCQTELAEDDFREAIALAQKMGAKAWELRATVSLARLLRDSNRRDEAHAMLAEIYNRFTEGFDTRDLQEARQLLNELDRES
jgi:predicted ATPase